jgi:hypothetical protein
VAGKEVVEERRMTTDRVERPAPLLAEDALISGLRLNNGVDLSACARRFPGEGPLSQSKGQKDGVNLGGVSTTAMGQSRPGHS